MASVSKRMRAIHHERRGGSTLRNVPKDHFEVTGGTLEAVRAEFAAVSRRRTTQLLSVAISLVVALATGWLAVKWNATHRHAADEWFPPHSLGPDVRGFIVVVVTFFVPGALALFSLISWFRVLDGRITGALGPIVEAVALKLEGPLSVRVFWGSPTTTSSGVNKVQFKSEDFALQAMVGGQPFSLTIEDHDSIWRRSSTSQRMHVTYWQVVARCGERTAEERIDGEALPVERVMAVVARVLG